MQNRCNPKRVTPRYARAVMGSNQEAIFIDVRTKQEYDTGHIPGAILLPDDDVEALAPFLLPDKDVLTIVYCQRGGRSQSAADVLVSMGYTNVCNLGGIDSWPYERE